MLICETPSHKLVGNGEKLIYETLSHKLQNFGNKEDKKKVFPLRSYYLLFRSLISSN